MEPTSREPDYSNPAYVNTLVHFYRGELGRMMVWRQRFDATTNWAIVATGSLIAYATGDPTMTNEAMVLAVSVLAFFAFLEARRFRFYDAFRARVRMLEIHFIAPTLLGQERKLLEGPWREHLAEDLILPSFKHSLFFALGRRFRRVYFALNLFVLFAWFGLIGLRLDPLTWSAWIGGFNLRYLPGKYVLAAVALYYALLFLLMLRAGGLRASVNEVRYVAHPTDWMIDV